MEEASGGDNEVSVETEYEEVVFFLLGSGVSEHLVNGWHSGWDSETIEKAFVFFKKKEIEKQRSETLSVALGASSLISKKPIEKFLKEVDSRVGKSPVEQKPSADVKEFSKLMGFFNGGKL